MRLELFTDFPWRQYLEEMSKSRTYENEITLRMMANIFNVEIVVKSTQGEGGKLIITLENSIWKTIVLGILKPYANPSLISSLILTTNQMRTSKAMLLCLISNLTQPVNRNLMVASSIWRITLVIY